MEASVQSASEWWADQLVDYGAEHYDILDFQNKLFELMMLKFRNHWFPMNPLKGQAYRSVTLDRRGHLDPLLVQAAQHIPNFIQLFPTEIESIVMWIDPDEVAVKIYSSYYQGGRDIVIYSVPPQYLKEMNSNLTPVKGYSPLHQSPVAHYGQYPPPHPPSPYRHPWMAPPPSTYPYPSYMEDPHNTVEYIPTNPKDKYYTYRPWNSKGPLPPLPENTTIFKKPMRVPA
eukprot:TRINITY_DN1008_c0_g1_i1.p1 TRINITY_DN1008_c0_g1~~TRINITY_DN1008_c0_g1_i1.p1  ORF type:complete len:241 (+),score=26.10 TRINITY_DN1008_c0_g1_i1:38-724(+)